MRTPADESPVTVPYELAHMALCGAVRWYVGRGTAAASVTADGIAGLLPQLTDATKGIMAQDIRRHIGDDSSRDRVNEPWARLLMAIEEDA